MPSKDHADEHSLDQTPGDERDANSGVTHRVSVPSAAPDRRLSNVVVEALATHHDVAATDLPKSLYEEIDPDALDALFRGGRGRVVFEYLDAVVTVDYRNGVHIAADD